VANSLLTPQQITRKALALFLNNNWLLRNVNRQYDSRFAQEGAKIGGTLNIRLPNDYTVTSGPTFTPQDTVERNTSLTISSQKHVDVSFSSADLALSMDDFSERILEPAMNVLAGSVAADLMTAVEGVPNLVHNVDGSNNTIAPTFDTWLAAGAILDQFGVPRGRTRKGILDPQTQRRTVNSFSGFFNKQSAVGDQYTTGEMDTAAGIGMNMDQTVIQHTTGTFTAGTVNGANQTGTTLTVNAITGTLKAGDVITIAGVNSINRTTKASNGTLAQFVVTADAANAATSISIYPAITLSTVAFGTVTASPANGAAITLATKASEVYRKNIVFDPRALTLATADLVQPKGVDMCYRAQFGGVSMRMLRDYILSSDQLGTRIDILYGYKLVRPEWAVAVADAL
jgi:P22 coat protein - gene protein 5